MVNWNPAFDVEGDRSAVLVSASDLEGDAQCGRGLALKVHKGARARGWRRLFPPRSAPDTFVLGIVRDVVSSLGSPITLSTDELKTRISTALSARRVIRQLRPYVEHAVWSALDALDSLESDVGPLRHVASNPEVGSAGRFLTVWADCYDTSNGLRQVHRLRFGSAHLAPTGTTDEWSATAAWIGASLTGRPTPTRIQVVDIGLLDGGTVVTFDGDVDAAKAAFDRSGPRKARALCDDDTVTPSYACATCKTAGVCSSLTVLDGFLGQPERGVASRALSPTDLRAYQTCPAQWLMSTSNLSREYTPSAAADRGRAVHRWLHAAHERGVPCTLADLPAAGADVSINGVAFDATEYDQALPFLSQHLQNCPLADAAAQVHSLEESLRGYDHKAEVIVAMAPDMAYSNGTSIILRETKTAGISPSSRQEAFDSHLQVGFALRMLESGLAGDYGFDHGVAELEVLTADSSTVWTWRTDDPIDMILAASQIELIAGPWHNDITWATSPSPACDWCALRRWCPDRDVWANRDATGVTPTATTPTPGPSAPAPF